MGANSNLFLMLQEQQVETNNEKINDKYKNYLYICIRRVVATIKNIIQIPPMIKTTTF